MAPEVAEVAQGVRDALPQYAARPPVARLVQLLADLDGCGGSESHPAAGPEDEERGVHSVVYRGRAAVGRTTLDCTLALVCDRLGELVPDELRALAATLHMHDCVRVVDVATTYAELSTTRWGSLSTTRWGSR